MRLFLISFVLIGMALTSCNSASRNIHSENYSGKVYVEKPQESDIPYTPSNKDISEFESTMLADFPGILNAETDTTIKAYRHKFLVDLKKYKRRYFGVITTESDKMLIVEFLHPDSYETDAQWKDSLWIPETKDYFYFRVHYYPDDKMIFNLTHYNYYSR